MVTLSITSCTDLQALLQQQHQQAAELAEQQVQLSSAVRSAVQAVPRASDAARLALSTGAQRITSAYGAAESEFSELPAAVQQLLSEQQAALVQGMQQLVAAGFAQAQKAVNARVATACSACLEGYAAAGAAVRQGERNVDAAEGAATAACSMLEASVATGVQRSAQVAAALRSLLPAAQQQSEAMHDTGDTAFAALQAKLSQAKQGLDEVGSVANRAMGEVHASGSDAEARWRVAASDLISGVPCVHGKMCMPV